MNHYRRITMMVAPPRIHKCESSPAVLLFLMTAALTFTGCNSGGMSDSFFRDTSAGFGRDTSRSGYTARLAIELYDIAAVEFSGANATLTESTRQRLCDLLVYGARKIVERGASQEKTATSVRRFAAAMIEAAREEPDGSFVLDVDSFERARFKLCPLYPFC